MSTRECLLPPVGRVRVHRIFPAMVLGTTPPCHGLPAVCRRRPRPPGWVRLTRWNKNLFLYEWATIVGTLLTQGATGYKIGGLYLEFENVASPGDPVTAPTPTRDADQGVAYYDSLALSANRDYLRVPLTAATLLVSDETNFPGGNECVFFGMSSGLEGIHGKPYDASSNSTLFGGALVAMPDDADASQDLVLSRTYLDVADQQQKLDTSQLGLEWSVLLQ